MAIFAGQVLVDGRKEGPLKIPGDPALSLALGFFSTLKALLSEGRISEDMNLMILQQTN